MDQYTLQVLQFWSALRYKDSRRTSGWEAGRIVQVEVTDTYAGVVVLREDVKIPNEGGAFFINGDGFENSMITVPFSCGL